MLKKSTARIAAIMFVLTLFLSVNVSASSKDKKSKARKAKISQTACAKTTDAEIVQAIKDKFAADSVIKEQMQHINISVNKRIVKLEGWLDGKASVAKAVAMAKKTNCVKKLTSRLKEKGGGSCGPGQRQCGDICIDRNSACTITSDPQN
jgi:osmotically-inducible protein OsmY